MGLGSLPLLAWLGFATFYYGFPLPNTYYAKLSTGISRADYLKQGWFYFQDLYWVVHGAQCVFREVLGSPAEQTHMGTMGDSGCHLEAAVGLDAVEGLFVAVSVVEQALLHPVAELHPGMGADDVAHNHWNQDRTSSLARLFLLEQLT
jgi:hypothetical protein